MKKIFPSSITEISNKFYVVSDGTYTVISEYIPSLYKKSESGTFKSIFGDSLSEVKFDSLQEFKSALYNEKYFGTVNATVQLIREAFSESQPIKNPKILNFDMEVSKFRYPLLGIINTKEFGKMSLLSFLREYSDEEYVFCPDKNEFLPYLKSDYNLSQIYSDAMVATNEITSISVKCGNGDIVCIIWGKPEDYKNDDRNTIIVKNEKELILKFIELFVEYSPEFITGWNSQSFDQNYLISRYEVLFNGLPVQLSPFKKIILNHQQDYDIVGVTHLDLLKCYKKFTHDEKESYSLEYISQYELNEGKIKYSGELTHLFVDDFSKFIEYNKVDVKRVHEINEKMKLIELAIQFVYLTKSKYSDVFGTIASADSTVFNFAADRGLIIPPKIKQSKELKYIGAKVNDPNKGVHRGMQAFFDITSLYPNTAISINVSPETLVSEKYLKSIDTKYSELLLKHYTDASGFVGISLEEFIKNGIHPNMKQALFECNLSLSGNGFLFKRGSLGIAPAIFKEFFDNRQNVRSNIGNGSDEDDKILDIEQMALKIFINSFYGALGQEHFRLYDIRLAEAITISGQFANMNAQKFVNKKLNELRNSTNKQFVIIGDTDSAAYNLTEFFPNYKELTDKENYKNIIKFCENEIYSEIETSFKYLHHSLNMNSNEFKMGLEAVGNGVIIRKKKNYAMKIITKSGDATFKVKGLECVRSNTPEFIRSHFHDLLVFILNGCSEEDFQIKFKNIRNRFFKLSDSKMASARNLNVFQKYKQIVAGTFQSRTPIHVKGAITHNNIIDYLGLGHKYSKLTGSQKIKMLYLVEPNIFKSNSLCYSENMPEEFKKCIEVDKNLQFDKYFLIPITTITDLLDWNPLKTKNMEF